MTNGKIKCIIYKSLKGTVYGGIAQLARALGSYPGCHRFKSSYRYQSAVLLVWPVGQEVKTPPFHGGIMGSNPVRVTRPYARKQRNIAVSEFFFYTENRLCPLLVRYCEFAADILVLTCAILRKKAERSVHRLSHSRLCSLEHMSIDVQSRSRIAMP